MLNREAQEIHPAKLKFDVSSDFKGLQHAVQECDYFTTQYYINNTCLDLTVMDVFGMRQTMPRRKDRSGDRVFRVVREYRFVKSLEHYSREFFDEIAPGDGPILMALKELVQKKDVFRFKGFTTDYDVGVRLGYLLIVTFEISEDEINEYKTVDSTGLGITVSRLRREAMPANPVYSAINNGSYYNPFKSFVGPQYSMTRIFANYHDQIKEKYWYNLGNIPVEVEYTRKPELEEGIHIQTFTKQEDNETATNSTIKIVKFDEASNKNGFFTSPRDAMLGSNTLRSDREKEQELKERAIILATKNAEAEEQLAQAKRQLALIKQQTDELNHFRQMELQGMQNDHAIVLEKNKRLVTDAEFRLAGGKLELSTLQLERDVVEFHQDSITEDKKHSLEVLKIQGSAIKHRQDLELATAKHGTTMRELDRAEVIVAAQHLSKLAIIEADLVHSASNNKRRLVEENTKLVTTVAGGLTTIGKLLF
jgi:hypothetical protein